MTKIASVCSYVFRSVGVFSLVKRPTDRPRFRDSGKPHSVEILGSRLDTWKSTGLTKLTNFGLWDFGEAARLFELRKRPCWKRKARRNAPCRGSFTHGAAMRVTQMLLAMALVAIAAPAVHAGCLTDTAVEGFFLGVVRCLASVTSIDPCASRFSLSVTVIRDADTPTNTASRPSPPRANRVEIVVVDRYRPKRARPDAPTFPPPLVALSRRARLFHRMATTDLTTRSLNTKKTLNARRKSPNRPRLPFLPRDRAA